MSTSANEDQEHRDNNGMKDSESMTIEYLRARLLSERSVSRTARQRADELAKRVAELEEQLRFVSFQRRKAEKATASVLAILENCGVSDASEGFDSCSDQDESQEKFEARNGPVMIKETLVDMKDKKSEPEAYSSSEVESSQSTGRSLSWKSTKNSQYSLEKKKYMDPVRRRASFTSNSSSAKRIGKSCRRVRRRETRSSEELQNDGVENVPCCRDVSKCSHGVQYGLQETGGFDNEKNPHERDENMESAMRHQVELIGQYEAEEKAQREWEEKFRDNNSSQQELYDHGNHSDVTEERYEIKSPELLQGAEILNSNNQETKQEPNSNIESLQDRNGSGMIADETSDFSFPTSKVNGSQLEFSTNHQELVVMPQKTSNNLGSVLEALQQAKLSLSQSLNNPPLVKGGTSIKRDNEDRFELPVASPGLFRLPTDEQSGVMVRANNFNMNVANIPPEIAGNRFESRSAFPGDRTTIGAMYPGIGVRSSFANFPPEITSNSLLSEPQVDSRIGGPISPNRMNQLNPYASPILPLNTRSYPFPANTTFPLPSTEGAYGTSNSETWLPPVTRLPLYDDLVIRRNMRM